MDQNIGRMERYARLAAGGAILGAGIYFQSWLGLIGVVPVATAVLGYCPAYSLIGFSTAPKERPKKGK